MSDENTVLVIDNETPESETLLSQIQYLGDNVSIVPYTVPYTRGKLTLLPGEVAEYKTFMAREFASFESLREFLRTSSVLRGLFSHEYCRRLDDSQFDRVVLGPDLNNHELALAAFADHDRGLSLTERIVPTDVRVSFPRRTQLPQHPFEKIAPRGSKRRKLVRTSLTLLLPKGSRRRRVAGGLRRKLQRQREPGSS